jgi:HAD superfamily hydrolase (TIGR01509 family)
MLRAVIFDFNGIIVDDEPIHLALFRRVLNEEDISLTEEEYYARYLGLDDRGAFSTAFRESGRRLTKQKLAELVDRKALYYREMIRNKMRLFPGVKALVPTLASELPLAIASGALRDEIGTILLSIGLRDYFRVIVSAEDVKSGKPEPEIFLKALERLNAQYGGGCHIAASECVVVEDSKEGIRGARRAGMKCLAVTNSHPAEQLTEASAVVKSLEEVTFSFLKSLCE